jgi:Fe-S-cluster containining protein
MIYLVKALHYISQTVDREWEAYLAKNKAAPTCKRGCHACCQLFALVSVPEMLGCLAELGPSEYVRLWKEKQSEHERQLRVLSSNRTVNNLTWLRGRHDCFFLRDGECVVYAARPAVCRTHVALTPPEWCGGLLEEDKTVVVDPKEVRRWAVEQYHDIALELGLASMGFAPLPIALDIALAYVRGDAQAANEAMRECGVDTPVRSLETWGHVEDKTLPAPIHIHTR